MRCSEHSVDCLISSGYTAFYFGDSAEFRHGWTPTEVEVTGRLSTAVFVYAMNSAFLRLYSIFAVDSDK